mmetsp:Transcript_4639/g.6870  ORF Transcript_4639/g.6870 Transcript_4639/m.6870 type:complete len:458 (-) Transcript_4639:1921-3294(-)
MGEESLGLFSKLLTSKSDDIDDDEIPMLVNLDDKNHSDPPPPIPVTILSGFLGSGKSTLVKFILNSPNHGKRIAIIENEFADSGSSSDQQQLTVETMIVKDGMTNANLAASFIELPNGCICCTVKDSLVSTLEALIERTSFSTNNSIDYIIIESSGMANPGGLASIFWLDGALESRIRLDGIVTCVDAKHIRAQLIDTMDEGEEAAQQIAYADRIILNKLDLIDVEESVLENIITAINPTAPLLKTKFCEVPDLSWILDANCFDIERAKDHQEELDNLSDHCHHPKECNQDCLHHSHQTHRHTSNITTVVLHSQGSVDMQLIKKWMAQILWTDQGSDESESSSKKAEYAKLPHGRKSKELSIKIMRVKGILSVLSDCYANDDDNATMEVSQAATATMDDRLDRRKHVVQAVHDLWEIQPCETLFFDENEERHCKIIIIGRFLDEESLRDGFQKCFVL